MNQVGKKKNQLKIQLSAKGKKNTTNIDTLNHGQEELSNDSEDERNQNLMIREQSNQRMSIIGMNKFIKKATAAKKLAD